ncbi:lipopolysaccharide biosynthesis protein [Asaia bogorensis]|uniref:Teichoic acid transporter n=1 Tax=Asaia bogorensis TaxID=91915 RepID=A0A060QIE9_9PROT|nr:hypothetical protein ASAP_2904 [Asaia bogorensis]
MSTHPSAARRIFHNVSFLTLGRIATAICSFAYIAFAVRALGLASFGLLILIHSLGIMASTFSRMQSWQTLIRYGNDPYARRDLVLLRQIIGFCIRLDLISAVVAVCIGVISVTFYAHVAHWSHWVTFLAYGYALICPFMYTGWSNGVLRLTERFHLVPVSDTCTAIFRTAGTAVGYGLHLDLGFFVLVWAGAVLMDYGLFLYFALSTLRQKIGLRLRWRDVLGQWRWQLPGMWAFTRSTSINQTLGAVSGHISTLVVGSLLGSAEAAVFRICRQIADGIVTPAQMLSPVLYPELVKMRDRQDWSGLKRLTWKIFGILCAVSIALLLVAAFFGGRANFLADAAYSSAWHHLLHLDHARFCGAHPSGRAARTLADGHGTDRLSHGQSYLDHTGLFSRALWSHTPFFADWRLLCDCAQQLRDVRDASVASRGQLPASTG